MQAILCLLSSVRVLFFLLFSYATTGKVVFTCMLNKFGGTESDVTVAKVPRVLRNSLESFKQAASGDAEPLYIACGGAVATYVQYHIQHILEDKQFDAKLIDISSKFGLLSLQGPIRYGGTLKCKAMRTEEDIPCLYCTYLTVLHLLRISVAFPLCCIAYCHNPSCSLLVNVHVLKVK